MDTISALAFGIIVVNAIRSKGVNDRKSIAIATAKAGLIAATGLVYMVRLAGSVQLASRSDMQRMVDNYLLLSCNNYSVHTAYFY